MPWTPLEGELFPTLGWHVADQMAEFMGYEVTREQLEFLIRFYEIDPLTCKRVKRRGVMQRSRGWGKSPFLASIGLAEGLFEVVPDGWDADGQPVAAPWSEFKRIVNVVITATSEDQVANTWAPMLDFARMDAMVDEFGIEPMESFIAIRGGKIEPRTSKGRSIKGLPGQVCAIMDQTEEWVPGNGGPRLAQNIRNNATKANGVTIESPNAFTPGENSVAEASARDWDLIQSGKYPKLSEARQVLYDHREAPATTDMSDHDSLVAGLRYAYGDSSDHPDGCVIHDPPCAPGWAPIETIALAFLDTSNDPQVLRADFLNQITHASDSWLSQPEVRAAAEAGRDKVVSRDEPVTLGFDGSEGRKQGVADSTVLVGYSVAQDHLFELGCWEQPKNWNPESQGPWQPPTLEVDAAVEKAHRDYNVVGFFADPSAGWSGNVATWESKHSRRYKAQVTKEQPIRYRQKDVTRTCEGFRDLEAGLRGGAVTIDGSEAMIRHFINGRRDPRRAGYVVKKPDDDQDHSKVDMAWGAMFAFLAGQEAIAKGVLLSKRTVPRRLY